MGIDAASGDGLGTPVACTVGDGERERERETGAVAGLDAVGITRVDSGDGVRVGGMGDVDEGAAVAVGVPSRVNG